MLKLWIRYIYNYPLKILVVPRLYEEKRGDLVYGILSVPPLPQAVDIMCMDLLLQFYYDCCETLRCLGHGLKMCILFGHNPQMIFLTKRTYM